MQVHPDHYTLAHTAILHALWGARQLSTRELAADTSKCVAVLASRALSAYKGYDVRYRPGVRQLTGRRQATNASIMALYSASLSAGSFMLWLRSKGVAPYAGLDDVSTDDLLVESALGLIVAVASGLELVSGRSLIRRYRLSLYGQAVNAVNLLTMAHRLSKNIGEIRRRQQIWQQIQHSSAAVHSD